MFRLTNEEKAFLFRLARRSLESAVHGATMEAPAQFPASLGNPGGAFVTLHRNGALRGCVGYVQPVKPLYQTVMEAAAAAALHDTRFPQVRPAELADLEVEISVLSPCREARLEEIQVGLHGLMVSRGFARGLLLPQVAVERDWTPLRFLEETCRKAGLPSAAWRRGVKIEAFTAEVFSEHTLAVEELRS
jgi:AmmeMemoRadiSam system protein A